MEVGASRPDAAKMSATQVPGAIRQMSASQVPERDHHWVSRGMSRTEDDESRGNLFSLKCVPNGDALLTR